MALREKLIWIRNHIAQKQKKAKKKQQQKTYFEWYVLQIFAW